MAIAATVISTVVAVAMSIAICPAVAVVAIIRVSLSLSISLSCRFGLPLAETGDSSIRVSRQTGGVVVAREPRVHVVVVAQNETVAVVGVGVGTPLAVVEAMTKAESLERPMGVGGGVAT